MATRKIILLEEKCYIIRSTRTTLDNKQIISYYMTPSMWTKAPTDGTIFTDYAAGEAHLNMYHSRDKAPKGWADGSTEILDVVTLIGEIEKTAIKAN